MSGAWYDDPLMLAAGNARRRPAGESDLAQPGSAEAMPPPPGPPFEPSQALVAQRAGQSFADALRAEADRVGLDPLDLARLYAKAYARPQPSTHCKPSIFSRIFNRKAS